MCRTTLTVALFALLPAAARAAIIAHVDPGTYTYNGQDQVVSWEVYVTDSDPNAVQHATAFTLEINVPEFTADGIRFLIPPKDNRGWVHYDENVKYPYIFPGDPDSAPFDPSGGSDYNTARMAGVIWTTGTSDVSPSGTGLGRIDVFVPKDSPFWGTAHFTPVVSQLAGGTPGHDEVYFVSGEQASFTALPEPTTLGALALAAPVLLLRRRNRAAV